MATKTAEYLAPPVAKGVRALDAIVFGRENDVSRQIEQALSDPDMFVRHCRETEMPASGTTVYVLNMFGEQGERMPSKRTREEWFAELRSLRTQNPGSALVVAADMEPALLADIGVEGAAEVEFMSSPEIWNPELVWARVGTALARARNAAKSAARAELSEQTMAPIAASDATAARARVQGALGQLPGPEARRSSLLDLLDIRVPDLRAPSGRLDARRIADALGVPMTRLAGAASVSRQALSQMPDSPAAQAGLDPVARVVGVLRELLEPTEVLQWLNTPHKQLRGKPPLELLTSGNAERVALMLERARDGGVD